MSGMCAHVDLSKSCSLFLYKLYDVEIFLVIISKCPTVSAHILVYRVKIHYDEEAADSASG